MSEQEQYDDNIIILLDDEGNEQEFELVSTLVYEGDTYVALIPASEVSENDILISESSADEDEYEDDGELIIMKLIEGESEDDDILEIVDDEMLLAQIASEFADLLEDEYEIET